MTPLFAKFGIDPSNSGTVLTVGLALIALALIRFFLKRKREPAPYQTLDSRRPASTKDRDNWEVNMHDTARNLMGELNSKITIVEQLVREANAASERLEKACDRAESLERRSP